MSKEQLFYSSMAYRFNCHKRGFVYWLQITDSHLSLLCVIFAYSKLGLKISKILLQIKGIHTLTISENPSHHLSPPETQ